MSLDLDVRYLDWAEHAAWDDAVSDSIGGSPYSMSGYLSSLADATGAKFRLLAVSGTERVEGGIGLYIRTKGTSEYVRGRYLLYYNGPFVRRVDGASSAAQEEHTLHVLSAIERELRQSEFDPVEIKSRAAVVDYRPFLENRWCARPCYSYEVDISDPDRCYENLHRNVRRQIRQAERAGIEMIRSEDVETFWAMHEETCLRKSFPTYLTKDKFIAWFSALKEKGLARLYLAGLSGAAPCAGILVLVSNHPVTHTVCAASINGKLPPGVNASLRWNVFRALSEEGFRANDLTDAHEPSVARFKRQLGAHLVVSQQLSRPPTARDHMRASLTITKDRLKKSVKKLLRRGVAK